MGSQQVSVSLSFLLFKIFNGKWGGSYEILKGGGARKKVRAPFS